MRANPGLRVVAAALLSLTAATAETATSHIVSSANAFLSTLDEKQRQSVMFAFDDAKQRVRWSNLPTAMVPRAGLSMGQLSAAQRSAAMALLASTLSKRGLEKVQQIMDGDEVLKQTDGGNGPGPAGRGPGGRGQGGPGPGGRGPGGGPMFGRDLYYISILGTPSERDPWMLQFGGHHLALNITIAGEHGVLTPSLTAAQPALYTLNGKTVRPLGAENDKAFTLLNALDDNQRKQAILNYKVADLVLGPGEDGKTIQPEGLKASQMNEKQRAMLLDLVSEWAAIVNESAAAARMAEIKAGINDTWFAWSGSTTAVPGHNGTAYFRVQGPALVIEFSPQALGGDLTLHVHTMYRDPTNDYGKKYAAK
jgi:hypothetical protein